ncbi:MAG TPA: hypothetical protein EYP57_01265 [Thermodesulfobacteriaceae bacterium]|nr:hypothetical protein [Thermodesulfobacteriaceae bacterium]
MANPDNSVREFSEDVRRRKRRRTLVLQAPDNAECWHPAYLGTLGYAMLASKTLRIALERFVHYHRVVSDIRFA